MTTWQDAKRYLSSLWLLDRNDDRPLNFHGAFVPAVAEGLILRHTQPGDWIWDPMAGSGTTGRTAHKLGRNCRMSDLSPASNLIFQADARTINWVTAHSGQGDEHPMIWYSQPLPDYKRFLFDLAILHPPYFNIIKFSNRPGDLGNCPDILTFLNHFEAVAENAGRHLKPGGYLGLVIGDVWQESQVVPLGFLCMERALTALGDGARLKAIVVKNIEGHAQHKRGQENLWLSRYHRWGAVRFDHEYIFSIQKGK